MEQNGILKIGQRSYDIHIRDNETAMLTDAHNRANERTMQNRSRRNRPPVQGNTRLSNTDSIGRANRIRQRLRSKLGEIMSSSLEDDVKKSLARNVQMQLDRVEQKIRQIRRRERAKEEEKRERAQEQQREKERLDEARLNESRRAERQQEERRRRRQSDLRPRSTNIRRDFLYSARQGGFDPYDNNLSVNISPGPAVSYNVKGQSGVMPDAPLPADAVDIIL